ncbi:hypothetical protein Tfont_01751 [Tepidimonas fonticaldi]|uniref:Uncharacterized protein n=1 Tax=Tepidimonas fonticaldi TaxID=1101373 RepID=A0A554XLH0_9BURK|nr:hypothetical protein [Tepidimonas fonticaldi]TSE36675.1 hypothetical protein Tfont_01751 [Tepidimonas fonticaldi]
MLTISSIAVAPAPQSTPTVRAQPVTPARPSNAVARDNAAGAVVAPQGEAARAQALAAPPVLAPVSPAQEGQRADGFANGAAPERSGLPLPAAGRDDPRAADAQAMADQEAAQARAAERDKRAREAHNADAQRRAEAQSRPGRPGDAAGRSGQKDFPEVKNPAQEAMDVQIKDLLPNMWKASRAAVDLMIGEEAVQAAQERAQRLEELQNRLNTRPLANLPPNDAAQNYGVAADTGNRPAPGGQIDQLA